MVPGVIVNNDGNQYVFKLSEIKKYSSNKFYMELNAKYYRNKDKIPIEKETIASITNRIEKKIQTNNKTEKAKNKIKWDTRKNEDNCFLFALKCVFPMFNDQKYLTMFKNKQASDQIELANQELESIGQGLKYVTSVDAVVNRFVKHNKGIKLIIFCLDATLIHAEAIKDDTFMQELQPYIVNLIRRKCTIKVYRKLVDDVIER